METKKCQLCEGTKFGEVVDLGHHPLADSFLSEESAGGPLKTYPLKVVMCERCGHAQLSFIVPPDERYRKMDYSYTASNSPVSVAHFKEMAESLSKLAGIREGDLAVDIGSNDGTLLLHFKDVAGARILGIEPSKNIAKIAMKRNVPTMNDFFGRESAKKIAEKGKAKVVTATNVFNHISDLKAFMRHLRASLAKDGVFAFEVPYFPALLKQGAFDTIYLEHASYFSVKPFDVFFRRNGFHIMSLETNDYMGGSIRVVVTKDGKKADRDAVERFIREEESYKTFSPERHAEFAGRVRKFKFGLMRKLLDAKAKGGRIVAIGAATKGNTLLNYCKIDASVVDFVTDGSPLKIGKRMPGSNIPIKPDEAITPEHTHALILPWNIASFLVKKLGRLKLKFIIPSMK